MRAAPPVEVQSALRGGWWGAAAGLWLVTLACFGAWLIWHLAGDEAPTFWAELPLLLAISLFAVGTLAAAGTLLWHARQEPMRLSWNGSHWVCVPVADAATPVWAQAVAGDVDLMLDLGDAMLLRWRALAPEHGRVVWLPVSQRAEPACWHALRVALSHPTAATLPHPGEAL
jgi:hypothetical protein